jgi:hypothetical protein
LRTSIRSQLVTKGYNIVTHQHFAANGNGEFDGFTFNPKEKLPAGVRMFVAGSAKPEPVEVKTKGDLANAIKDQVVAQYAGIMPQELRDEIAKSLEGLIASISVEEVSDDDGALTCEQIGGFPDLFEQHQLDVERKAGSKLVKLLRAHNAHELLNDKGDYSLTIFTPGRELDADTLNLCIDETSDYGDSTSITLDVESVLSVIAAHYPKTYLRVMRDLYPVPAMIHGGTLDGDTDAADARADELSKVIHGIYHMAIETHNAEHEAANGDDAAPADEEKSNEVGA